MKKEIIGFLLFVILTSSFYVMIPDAVRIDIQETKSEFRVYENNEWVLSGTEWVNLFDKTAKMRANSRGLNQSVNGTEITIQRFALYKDNISVHEIYVFNGNTTDVKLFPISHSIQVLNGQGKILQYEVKDLLYSGETIKDITSPQSFGHKMKVEWDVGNYYSRIYKYFYKDEGKLTVKYKITNANSSYNVRLFDPAEFIVTLNSPVDNYNTTDTTPDFNFTVTGTESNYSCELFVDTTGYGVNATTLNDTATVITANATVSAGTYSWYVNCTSGVVVNQSEIREITIEAPLTITLNAPIDYYTTTDTTPEFNFTVAGIKNTYTCELFLNDTGYGFFNKSWLDKDNIVNGLNIVDSNAMPMVFYKDATWYLIAGNSTGLFTGYNWSGTAWQVDNVISGGLGDIGGYVTPYVFYKNTTWYLISGAVDGTFTGFNWSGSVWQSDNVINGSLGDVGDDSAPTIFEKDSIWYLISGENSYGKFNGFNWTGSEWQVDSTILSGISSTSAYSKPMVFEKDNVLYLIYGDFDGRFTGYNWSGTAWQVDTDINNNLGDIGTLSAPTIFEKDNVLYLIAGNSDGLFTGFNWMIINNTATVIIVNDTLIDGVYEWYIKCTGATLFSQSESKYLTIDTVNPLIGFIPPTEDDGKHVVENYTTINWSITELYQDTVIFNWDGVNTTMTENEINKSDVFGIYTYYVWVNDTAGNSNQTETRTIEFDNVSPTITVYNPTNTTYNTITINLNVSADETIDTWWYSLNGASNTTFTPNTTITGIEDQNNITVYANDTFGYENSSDVIYFTIDTTPPQITIYSPVNITYYDISEMVLNITINEEPIEMIYNLNDDGNISLPLIDISYINGSQMTSIIFTDIILDSDDNIHVILRKSGVLYYAFYNETWTIELVDSTLNVTDKVSIGVNSTNIPYIVYKNSTSGFLGYGYRNGFEDWTLNDLSDNSVNIETPNIAIDGNDDLHISFWNNSDKLSYVFINTTGIYVEQLEHSGSNNDIAVDSNNIPHIIYSHTSPYWTKHAYKSGDVWVTEYSHPVTYAANIDMKIINDKIYYSWYSANWLALTTNKNGLWVTTQISTNTHEYDTSISVASNGDISRLLSYNVSTSIGTLFIVQDTTVVSNISITDCAYSSTVSTIDKYYIMCSSTGGSTKFITVDYNFNKTISTLDGQNNITIYTTDLYDNMNSTTVYFFIGNTSITVNYTSGDYLDFDVTSYDGTFAAIGQNDTTPAINVTNVGNVNMYVNITVNTTQESCMSFWMSEDATLNVSEDYNVTNTEQTLITDLDINESNYLWSWMIFDSCTAGTLLWYTDYYDSYMS